MYPLTVVQLLLAVNCAHSYILSNEDEISFKTSVNLRGNLLHNVGTPVSDSDAANRGFVLANGGSGALLTPELSIAIPSEGDVGQNVMVWGKEFENIPGNALQCRFGNITTPATYLSRLSVQCTAVFYEEAMLVPFVPISVPFQVSQTGGRTWSREEELTYAYNVAPVLEELDVDEVTERIELRIADDVKYGTNHPRFELSRMSGFCDFRKGTETLQTPLTMISDQVVRCAWPNGSFFNDTVYLKIDEWFPEVECWKPFYQSCVDAYDHGRTTDDVYLVETSTDVYEEVYCLQSVDGGGWMVWARTKNMPSCSAVNTRKAIPPTALESDGVEAWIVPTKFTSIANELLFFDGASSDWATFTIGSQSLRDALSGPDSSNVVSISAVVSRHSGYRECSYNTLDQYRNDQSQFDFADGYGWNGSGFNICANAEGGAFDSPLCSPSTVSYKCESVCQCDAGKCYYETLDQVWAIR